MSQKPHHYQPMPRTEIDASNAITPYDETDLGTALIETEIAAQELTHISLGEFPADYAASFYIRNNTGLKDIEYWLTQLKNQTSNEFVLHVFNYSSKTTCIEVGMVPR